MIAVLAAAVTVVLVYSFVGDQGFVRLGQMINRRNILRMRVNDLERANAETAREINRLRTDHGTIEDLARTRLGMVRSGEIVYIFPDDAGNLKK